MTRNVRIGLIGTSGWSEAMYVASLTSHPDAKLAAICGRNAARAAEVAAKVGAKLFTDYREMIASGEIDAVIVASPDDQHAAMTLAALDAKLHVLCEKPLAGNVAAAREMRDRAVAAGVVNMVLFTWRWQPEWAAMRRMAVEGGLGRIHHASFDFIVPLSNGVYQWRFDRTRANGALGDLGPHALDMAHWMVGDIGDLSAILSTSAKWPDTPEPANDGGSLILRFKNGATGSVELSACATLSTGSFRIDLYGDKATLRVELTFFGEAAGFRTSLTEKGASEPHPLPIPAELSAGLAPGDDWMAPYTKQSAGPRAFVDAILAGKRSAPDFNDGLKVQRVIDAAIRSDTEGRRIDIA